MAQGNVIFGTFNLHDEFFVKHQLNYLGDIVRVLYYTDEFAPFGYRNLAQIVQMACGTNTAFLFSMQSLAQLMHSRKK
jgi:hypothetical protein